MNSKIKLFRSAMHRAFFLIVLGALSANATGAAIVLKLDGTATVITGDGNVGPVEAGMVLVAGDEIRAGAESLVEVVVPSISLDAIKVIDGDHWKVPNGEAVATLNLETIRRTRAGVNWRGLASAVSRFVGPAQLDNGPLLPSWTRLVRPQLLLSWADTPLERAELNVSLHHGETGDILEHHRVTKSVIKLPVEVAIEPDVEYFWTISRDGDELARGRFEVLPNAEVRSLRERAAQLGAGQGVDHPNKWIVIAALLMDAHLYLDAGRVLSEAYSENGSPTARAWLERVRDILSGIGVRDSVETRAGEVNKQGAQNEK